MNSQPHYPANPDKFEFDAEVTALFDDMAVRSIPGYVHAHDWIRYLCMRFQPPQFTQVWDFGTSTGSALKAAINGLCDPTLEYIGVDNSAPMLERARTCNEYATFLQHDLNDGMPDEMRANGVAVAIFGWTLQFLSDRWMRCHLLTQTYHHLVPGGLMFVFEKFKFSDPDMQAAADRSYYWWRRRQGYSYDEIEAKSKALAHSMFPWEHEALENLAMGLPNAKVEWVYRLHQFGGVVITKK